MSAIQPPLAAAPHRNQQLFSDYYLNTILPQRPEWQLLAADARSVLDRLRAIFATYTPSNNEAQTERDLVRPVLEALGHTFEVQAALRTPRGTKKPDYVFYRNAAALAANKDRVLDAAALATTAFAIGDAKHWDRPLDVSLRLAHSGADINKIPSDQIAFYMLHSGVAWGILTNGRLWRLYHKDTAQQQTRFYEVDLAALVEANDVENFLYAYAFFHRSAFEPRPLGLDQLLRASADYARGISEGLKAQVFDALRHLAQGFLDYPANGLQPDPPTLKAIYDHSLIVLYRLLFILYAEARELLPLRASDAYRDEYSLDAIKREVARRKTYGPALLPTTARLWAKLRDLFGIISLGSPPLKVATFNGGLFDAARYPFLERYSVGDARLQEAVDMLVRVGGEFVDYRDLAERNLGTIYEGLLEYHLQSITPEGAWTVELFNDRGERHRTGSYYTPDFVVQYIVAQTLGPVLDAAVAGKTSDAEKIAAVLAVNVADLAMGSGHFPVAATDYIARYIVDLDVAPDADAGGEADLLYWKRRVAQSCIYGVDLNPLAVDLAKLSLWLATAAKDRPLSFLDHHLRCGNALVGARVADLAVTSGTTTKRRASNPKSKIANGQSAQLSLLDDSDFARSMGVAVGSMWLIEATAGNTVAEVKEQERVYAALRDELTRRYARVANLVTATHFGLQVDLALWQPLADFAAGRALAAFPKFTEWIAEAERLADAQHFFHWELEFPEVFYDRNGQHLGDKAGFDAVIGNPPYVRQELLAPIKPFLGQAFGDVYHGVADISVYFLAQGMRLLQNGGALSYITSGMFRKLDYGQPLRRWIANNGTVETIISFGEHQVFEDATTYPIIIAARRSSPPSVAATQIHEATSFTDLLPTQQERYALPSDGAAWTFVSPKLQHILEGWPGSRSLREHLAAPIYRGVTTGLERCLRSRWRNAHTHRCRRSL